MPKQNRFRFLGEVAFVKNSVKSFDLPRALLYHNLSLRLKGQVDIVTASPTAWAEAPWSLIRRIEIVVDGKDTIKSLDFEFLKAFNQVMYGTAPSGSAMPVAVATDQNFNAHAILPFEMPRSIRPIDTLLDSKNLSTFQLIITWGDENSVYSALPANATLDPALTKLEIGAYESFGIGGRFSVFKQLNLTKDVAAVTPDFQVILPVGNIYRAFFVKGINYGASPANVDPGTPSNAVIQNLKLQSGTEVFFNKKANELQDDNKRLFGIESWPAGYHVLEFATDGLLTESLDARGLSSLDLVLDVLNPATTNRVKVYPMEVISPPAQPAGVGVGRAVGRGR